ncbi:cadherin-related family member 5 isoform X1 [Anarrhichthys ocellatus]|uniref:cadherin-related family member 5 isoform X1 n=1 Tax=Anarrhichthys ocellatus TaxID=433405 RepID=UPI0012EDA7C5|nr:cadherin-related family member 5-like isoform X1 [Anarrhichthys ocellatus]
MDGIHPYFTVRTSVCFLLLILLRTSAANICSAASLVNFPENNTVGALVLTIVIQAGVTVEFEPPANPDNPFRLAGNNLVAARVLDYETGRTHVVDIICSERATGSMLSLSIVVVLENVNDNHPVFDQNPYHVNVSEMSPLGTSVGRFEATDLDVQTISYTLTSEFNGFTLMSSTNPDLLVAMRLDYEKVQNVQLILTAQDTPLAGVSFTATTTILVTILDGDNRPPWFQPCSKHEVGGAVICQSNGYTGRVVLNEQETGVLPLEPGPLYAIDGDSGINEEVTYSFLAGDGGGLFQINPNTGNITMLKPADVLEPISLTVLAAQKTNSFQFATTTVTVNVQVKSLHHPQFQRPQYNGVITGVGIMAMDLKAKDEPLRILATDDDYMATGGINPHITYSFDGHSDVSIVGGYLFMTTDLPEQTLSLQLVALDTANGESASAQLFLEVTSGLTTTSLPLSTTDSMATTSIGETSTDSKTTEEVSTSNPTASTSISLSTTAAGTTSEGSNSTINPSVTSEGSASTGSTAHPHTVIVPSGGYGPVDMAALGATLGVLLLVCLVVIVVLALRIRRGDADWRKIFEASVFQSSLGQGGQKGAIQYTNEAFQNDEDGDSTGSGGPAAGSVRAGGGAGEVPLVAKSPVPLRALPRDDVSQAGSDSADNEEKEVRPILTKERRVDDGYKAVWFKEDIDPNAKEEVVIIPDSREDDSEEEDEELSSSGREDDEDEDDGPRVKTQRVGFNDADLDSGLGVKMEDREDDSEGDEALTVSL